MTNFRGRRPAGSAAREFFETVWPGISSADSDLQRKKKIAIRCAQLTVVVMVVAPVTGALITGFGRISPFRIDCLVLASPVYIFWSLYGMHDVLRLLFREPAKELPPPWIPRAPLGPVIYFAVQLTLAGLICYSSGDAQ
jgi:hypothetical protein